MNILITLIRCAAYCYLIDGCFELLSRHAEVTIENKKPETEKAAKEA